MRPCPKCDSPIEETAVFCRYCRARLVEPAARSTAVAAAGSPGRPPEKPFEVIDVPAQPTGRPWEVWVVIGIIALNIVGGLTQGRFGGIIVGFLIISGLLKQSNGAWWFVTIINGIAAIVFFCLAASMGAEMLINGAVSLLVAGLLISCRVRGAYAQPMD